MTAVVSYTISSTENFTSPGFTITDPATQFPAIWGNEDYKFTVTFSVTDDEYPGSSVTGVTVNSFPDFVNTSLIGSNGVRIEKKEGEIIFPGEFFRFVEFDENFNPTEAIIEPEEVDAEQSVILWNTPPVEIIDSNYSFTIDYTDGIVSLSTTVPYSQELHWLLDPGLTTLLDLVDRSKY
jgi:hypothetical protein